MSLIGDIGKVLGGAVGSAILPGIGTAIGSAVGGAVGDIAGKAASKVFDDFQKDPIGTLANPTSAQTKFVDNVLEQLGVPKPFRTLAKYAQDPTAAVQDFLHNGCKNPVRPVSVGGGTAALPPGEHGLTTNGKDVIDTGRYLISAREDGVKVYDKQTNTWIDAHGDPHLSTSDGDKAQFHDNLTIDLQDGTKLTIKTTPKDCHGVSYIDSVAVTKEMEAVVATGFHDGKAGVNMGNVLTNADTVDRQYTDGTVLRAGHQVDDLTFARDGKEIKGGDATQRWGEHNLDGKGGKSMYGFEPLPHPRPLPFPLHFPLPCRPGLDLNGIKDQLNRLPKDVSNAVKKGFEDLLKRFEGDLDKMEGKNGAGKPSSAGRSSAADRTADSPAAQETGDDAPVGKGGGDIYSRLFAVLAKLQKQMEKKLGQIEQQANKMDAAGTDNPNASVDKAAMDKLQFQLQQLQQMMQQITTTATNLLKTEGDTRMSIIKNMA